jgi:hypothetical protein
MAQTYRLSPSSPSCPESSGQRTSLERPPDPTATAESIAPGARQQLSAARGLTLFVYNRDIPSCGAATPTSVSSYVVW